MKTLTEESRSLRNALAALAEATTVDLQVRQVMILLRIAEGGDQGVDAGRLAEDTGASPASVSRTVRTLGEIHYSKEHAGFGLVEIQFDPTDNRRRVIKLTPDGRALIRTVLGKI
jgi:DNA-binding MarR family transcriptional regulator